MGRRQRTTAQPRRRREVGAFLLAVTVAASAASATLITTPAGATPSTAPPAPVPSAYQPLYATLQSQLHGFAAAAPTHPAAGSTILSSALLSADGNVMFPGVLQTNLLRTSTTLIQRLKANGQRGITLQVSFPLLVTSFPDSEEYTTFYADVANAVHAAGMTLTVEENPLFGNISTLPIQSYYRGLTLPSYAAADQQMAQTIIHVMRPRYLSILNEPDTYTAVIHNPAIDLTAPATGAQFVNLVENGLARHGTLVGAGTGTWTGPAYDRTLLAQTPIDFLDLHLYPVAATNVATLQAQVAAAGAAHKPIVMSECWLYKETTSGLPSDSVQAAPNEQKVGTFSFWEPLDEQFLTTMVDYARAHHFLVVSPFSTLNFFAYQTWTPALQAATPQQARATYDQQALAALSSGQLSGTGETYRHLAR